ncbi:MAG: NAD-dependent epimerase/dehydratase family protein [Candidatus Bathyarchaeia archaeon]|jgi:nucleoside-diphosphate-sugar epimerase
MKRCLVTGGKGFIGSHLVNFLKRQGNWVRSADIKDSSYLKTEEDEFLRLDLREKENAMKAVKGIDYVWTLAANMGGIGFITEKHADIAYDNVMINSNMIKSAVEQNVGRLFYSSSACVYPEELQSNDKIVAFLKEKDAYPANPDSVYGWEKLYTEIMCKAFERDYGLDVRIARFHNIYGPYGTYDGGREKAPAALCRKVAMAKNNGQIEIWGNGKQIRSFMYVDDCCEAVYRLTNSSYKEPLNIGTDKAVTIDQLADMIIKISGKKLTKKYDTSKPVGVKSRNADLDELRKVLRWQPKIGYEEGLEKTYQWISEMVTKVHG